MLRGAPAAQLLDIDLLIAAGATPAAIVVSGTPAPQWPADPGDSVFVTLRPMAETVKRVESGIVCETIDRADLQVADFPVVASSRILAQVLRETGDPGDILPALICGLWPLASLG